MIKSIVLAFIGLVLIILVILNSKGMHFPILSIMVVSIGIGFLNPEKGWIVASVLVICLIIFGTAFENLELKVESVKLTHFICNISILPILFGGFMGKYFHRALKE